MAIDFSLSPQQEALRQLAHDFAEKEIKPRAAELDRIQDPAAIFPWDIYEKGNRLGFNKVLIPTEYGGLGLGEVEQCLVVEELSWADAGIGSTYFVHAMQILLMDDLCTEEQKAKWFPAVVNDPEDRFFISIASTEHGVAGDLAPRDYRAGRVKVGALTPADWATHTPVPMALRREVITVAEPDGNGSFIINGTKRFITSGGRSKLILVTCRKGCDSNDVPGAMFLVPADNPGVRIGHIEDKIGQRLMQNAEVIFENAVVPAENEMLPLGSRGVRGGDVEVAAVFTGLARRAYEEALAYAKVRYKGGARIIFHQAIQMMLCDMAIKVLTSRLLMLRAAWQNDQKAGYTAHNNMAKVYCTDVAVDVTNKALQVFGGYGLMRDFPMEKLYRDARIGPIYHATNEMVMVGQLIQWLASMDTIY